MSASIGSFCYYSIILKQSRTMEDATATLANKSARRRAQRADYRQQQKSTRLAAKEAASKDSEFTASEQGRLEELEGHAAHQQCWLLYRVASQQRRTGPRHWTRRMCVTNMAPHGAAPRFVIARFGGIGARGTGRDRHATRQPAFSQGQGLSSYKTHKVSRSMWR